VPCPDRGRPVRRSLICRNLRNRGLVHRIHAGVSTGSPPT
jgi:hypothetical protein